MPKNIKNILKSLRAFGLFAGIIIMALALVQLSANRTAISKEDARKADPGPAVWFKNYEIYTDIKELYLRNPEWNRPEFVFKINKDEYLVTEEYVADRVSGFYYINLLDNTHKIEEVAPNPNINREFYGGNKKKYALYSWGIMRHGISENGYGIINLIPKNNGKVFTIYKLISGLDVSEELDANALCENKNDNIIMGQPGYKILNEGTSDVGIEFNITILSCNNMKTTYSKKIFKLNDGIFKEIN